MGVRAYNFNPGPAALPLEVLRQAQEELVEYQGLGMSLMEASHRAAKVQEINDEAQALLLELLGIKEGYHVLFMGGGASQQFAQIPMNFLTPEKTAAYAITGSFAEKAFEEASYYGKAAIVASSKEQGWSRIPGGNEYQLPADTAYVHICTNNTIEGSQYKDIPNVNAPLVADMSSDILGIQRDASKFDFIYAGAQKNLGPAGVTVVVAKDDFVAQGTKNIPVIFRYGTFLKNNSLYNTPPVQAIYMVNLVLKWVKANGGVAAMEAQNIKKADLLYNVVDASGGFYTTKIEKPYRSIMNVTWNMKDEETEKQFLKECKEQGFVGLAGHRSVGGMRASIYNAVPYEAVKAVADFMQDYQKRNG
ncbi:3-phosphoserine/phosphohydroxythreonine transaminase [Gorillibacterium massiliense]|uniref:3-phosphoserine/phosphohydroxythreonine transaminase n=1 Tax=Gorillibacterium massiliense TaxID=1280390 RepID=UPI0004BA9C83|nr:3-phosphoserine/phosphohydroxythreonine transaminase [Gorillibacterium massiliense]